MIKINAVIAVLKGEQALRTRHCQLLEAQQRALLACDREQFRKLETQHAALLAMLETQNALRTEALTDEQGAALTISALLETMPESKERRIIVVLRDGLHLMLEKARTLSTRNQMLIQNELNYLAFSLDLFVEAGRSASLGYGGHAVLSGRLGLDRRA